MDWENAPLGPEDATKRDDIEESFVDLGRLMPDARLGPRGVGTRVVVGRKGSGKTHVLLHIENKSREEGRDVSFASIDQDLLSDSAIRPWQGRANSASASAFWTDVWRYSVIVAVMSRFTAKRSPQRAKDALERAGVTLEELKQSFQPLIFETPEPLSPVSALYRLRGRFQSEASFRQLRQQVFFDEVENELGRILNEYGEVHFIIDGLDEFAWIDPRAWLEVQLGLFKFVFLQTASRSFLRRVHLTISLRDYVYNHALEDTHCDRVGAGTGLMRLTWDAAAAEEFLNERLLQIVDGRFARAALLKGERPLARWLGFSEFVPHRRGRPERVEYYLLRHTRCAPRQAIRMFNTLCSAQNRAQQQKGELLTPQDFGLIVSKEARETAGNMMRTAAEELLSFFAYELNLPDKGAARREAQDYHISTAAAALRSAISACGSEIVSREAFSDACATEMLDVISRADEADLRQVIEDTLWRSGVIAFSERQGERTRWCFTWSENTGDGRRLPGHVKEVGLHPAMLDLCGLEVSEHGPVF